jgi:hypothetical protein
VPVSLAAPRSRAVLSVPALLLAAVTIAGCGGSSGATKAGGAATSAAVSPAAGSSSAGGRGGGTNGFAAFTTCLKQHGVTIPTRPPGGTRPSGAPRTRGGGGFGGGAFATSGPAAAAAKACASLRPTGGFGGVQGNAQLQSELAAYRTCLSDHGVVLPTPAAPASGAPRRNGFGGLGALSTADPKTAAALKACAPLRPAFAGGRPGAGGAPRPTLTPSP